ncbi:hypothetical protein [Qaidamihabitans albus]|uniref:hypothetical protein n=1 Tax=Qaidamihabitans albus TaxID=2795733 RepID=UPI0018F13BF2|nr:hypothetical protein [Qaidamihabitans albus]
MDDDPAGKVCETVVTLAEQDRRRDGTLAGSPAGPESASRTGHDCPVRIPPLDVVVRVVAALREQGLTPAIGGSGLLVALGLADVAHDWDVTVDSGGTAGAAAVTAALDGAGIRYREDSERGGIYATGRRYVLDGGDHTLDLLLDFAMYGPDGAERLPTRVSGHWRGLPLADPAVWARAYRLLDRPAKADALERWLTASS